jgi:3-dehydroquinate synthase
MAASVTLTVELGARAYSIVVARGVATLGAEVTRALGPAHGRRAALVADPTAARLHGAGVRAALIGAGFDLVELPVEGGEPRKQLATVEHVCDQLTRAGLDRHSPLFVLGGGVVGDLGGFAAACFLRGVDYVHLPTTLLAQVDSSIGGKTGVNLAAGKNLVGAFWQPRLVYADVATLATLPPRELAAGLAEVVKYGVIADETILTRLETRWPAPGNPIDENLLQELVADSAAIKAGVVTRDEREGGERALLNFGHTVGHAIEAATGYTALLHGEAVALGMLAACRVSVRYGGDPVLEGRLRKLLARLSLPTDIDNYLTDVVLDHLATDKKRAGTHIRFVVAERAGKAHTELIELSELRALFTKGALS